MSSQPVAGTADVPVRIASVARSGVFVRNGEVPVNTCSRYALSADETSTPRGCPRGDPARPRSPARQAANQGRGPRFVLDFPTSNLQHFLKGIFICEF